MRRYLLFFLLSISLTTAAQVVVTSSGQATTPGPGIIPAQPGAPNVVPANIALPGSGPATGLPPSIDVNNDARTGGAVSVYQPPETINGVPAPAPVEAAAGIAAVNTNTNAASTSSSNTVDMTRPVNLGLQNYVGAKTTVAAGQEQSLGEIAREVKSRHTQPVRTFTNESLGLPANNSEEQKQPNPNISQLPNGRSTPADVVLDRNDLAKVEAALQNHENGGAQTTETASAQPPVNPAAEYARITSEADKAQGTSQNNASAQPKSNQTANGRGGLEDQLPSSSSLLPLFTLLGFAGFAGGMAYRYGRR